VVAEGLRGEIRLIADGYDALRQDVVQLTAGQERIETRMDRLEIRQLALEDRQGKLEDRQGKLEEGHRGLVTEVRLLAARLPA
jgi:chromosome segregation ATPase